MRAERERIATYPAHGEEDATAAEQPDLRPITGAHPRLGPWAWALAGLTLLTWWRAFTTYFAQDDFHWLLKAAGDDPTPPWAPRYLSMNLYFRAIEGLGGEPLIFHALGVAIFLAAGLLFHRALARYVSPGLAAAAAALWLTSPAVFTALHWASAVSDLLCALFLAGCVLLLVDGRWERLRPVAPLLFGLALASKEVAVGAGPVLAILDWRLHGGPGRLRALLYVGMAVVVAVLALGPLGVAAGQAYALDPLALLRNLPAYMAASVFAAASTQFNSSPESSQPVWVLCAGWTLLAVWVGLLIRRRSAGAWLGAVWYLALLGPVLPLERQFYFYYMLAALPGLYASAILLACGVGRDRRVRTLAVACVLLVAVQLAAVQVRQGSQLQSAPLPTDFVLRRAQIARSAVKDLEAQEGKLGPQVVLLGQQPVAFSSGGRNITTPTAYQTDPFWDGNVWSALGEGDALRWRFPHIRTVEFRRWLGPEDRDRTVVAFEVDGHLRVLDYASYSGVPPTDTAGTLAARLSRADRYMTRRMFPSALAELKAAAEIAPGNATVQLNVGTLTAMLGDTTAATRVIASVVERFPHHDEARYNLGLLYWRAGQSGEARRTWEPLLARSPESDLARAARDLMEGRAR